MYFIASRGDWTSWEYRDARAHHNKQSSSKYAGKTGHWQRLLTSSASDSEDTGKAQRFLRDSGAAISAVHIREHTSVYIAQFHAAPLTAGGKGALESKVYKIEECSVFLRCERCDTVWLGEWFQNYLSASR